MKKFVTSIAAAALLVIPFAGNADAAQVQPKTKVVYYTVNSGDYANYSKLLEQFFNDYYKVEWKKAKQETTKNIKNQRKNQK